MSLFRIPCRDLVHGSTCHYDSIDWCLYVFFDLKDKGAYVLEYETLARVA
jgi:hypothetical protein